LMSRKNLRCPMRVRDTVGIQERNEVATRVPHSDVSRITRIPAVWESQEFNSGEQSGDDIGRAILPAIDNDDLSRLDRLALQ